ncbi:MAG: hypothetical protein GVY33_13805 [Alphaproteobacteria bacterium]|nr:hypothetical protein [Alphaproteobacteria bacterium]
MPAKTTLNAANLETLGTERLAALVLELVDGDAAAKRRARLELAARHDPGELARAVRKRWQTVARASSLLDTENQRALARDLDAHRRAVVDQLASPRPDEALDLLLRLIELRPAVFGRCHWSDDALLGVFEDAAAELAGLIDAARPAPAPLAERVARLVAADGWNGALDVVDAVAPRLGADGRDHLRVRLEAARCERAARDRGHRLVAALARLADIDGDVDAFSALFDADARRAPAIAAGIARRLLDAGRAGDAAAALAEVPPGGTRWPERDRVEADVMEALGDVAGAQAHRWAGFAETLDPDHLRAFLKRLPDFDDVEAEKRAFGVARAFARVHAALDFLLAWPAPREAAKLVTERAEEFDGDRWQLLSPAADTLGEKHPLSATLLRRAMIEATLTRKRTTRYGHAARHWRECGALAERVEDFGRFETHDAFRHRMEADHGRKSGFWNRVAER